MNNSTMMMMVKMAVILNIYLFLHITPLYNSELMMKFLKGTNSIVKMTISNNRILIEDFCKAIIISLTMMPI